ncbi:YciI family protein [Sphingomonas morindae]|uniref:YciI family protein n=1 Tax=Sphingomonas morindae TaxID=1541170 RepID=A0ABY4X8W1_9SPHN|nr:YciI family protein [Sphingomonas morindae]USI73343.1 YciI family protein [Sphingomonas morindae]
MKPFMILARDHADAGTLRAETRPRHLAYLKTLGERILRAGPLLDPAGAPQGSLILAEFDGLDAARAFAAGDPYAEAGLFASLEVCEWRHVLP